ncbi:MAG: Nre family DNA repair protein, partial [Candidatus Bathyarchaeia archaeon]
ERNSRVCLLCRGGRNLCGKLRCPVIARLEALAGLNGLVDGELIEGSTPPAVFVGRIGYPKVSIGPMIPPYYGNTEILDTPEQWMGRSIDDIIRFRMSLIRGKSRSHILQAREPSGLLETLQELAMGEKPTETEAAFTKKPRKVLVLSDEAQPFGPTAPLKRFKTAQVSVDRRIERTYYDRDLRASEAIASLYMSGVPVTRIQRSFSLGMFGVSARRRLVPTRWAITAVDSTLSLRLLTEIKQFPTIDEYLVYSFKNIGNSYAAVLLPEKWSFEWIEAWFPRTFWNPSGSNPELMGDFEPYDGRTTYASVGGCYYSARLALAERLRSERRQASGLLMREIHPDYILPVGVWNVRESLRAMLKTCPARFDNFEEALSRALKTMTVPVQRWAGSSRIIREARSQRKLTEHI